MADYKTKQTYNVTGHAHELTFSTYRRLDLLRDDETCEHFLHCLDKARIRHGFDVWAYVLMPNHVHLLVWPTMEDASVSQFLRFKNAVAIQALHRIEEYDPGLFQMLECPFDKGRARRFWLRGGGCDRNLFSPEAIWRSIEYIHMNPIRRGLVDDPLSWKWSSANAYVGLSDLPLSIDICPLRRDEAKMG